MVCGTTAAVGGHGTPNWDTANAATTGCLAFAWKNPAKTAMTCYFCNGFKDSKTKTQAVLNLPAFVSPVTNDFKVLGWMMVHTDTGGVVSLLMPDVPTNNLMAIKAVTACGGPGTIMAGGKGLKVTWTMTT